MTSTTTTQPLSRASIEIADKTEAGRNIRDIPAVCDSLNKLHETWLVMLGATEDLILRWIMAITAV